MICDIVYCELSQGMESIEETDAAIDKLSIERIHLSKECLFKAGRTFLEYKRRGGEKFNVLSDFFIGALAVTEGIPLLTGNIRDFRNLFPEIRLISP